MRSWLKSYLTFCGLALKEFKSGREAKWMRLFYLASGFVIAIVLDLVLGIPVRQWAKSIFDLLHWHWWIVIFLSLVALFLMIIIEGARRYHHKTVKELNAEHVSDADERERRADIIYRLGVVFGMILQADDTIRDYSTPLPKEALVYLNANIDSTLYQCFGAQGRDEYYEHKRPVPDSADEQRGWIYSHRTSLNAYIDHQKKQLAALKSKPKQLPPRTSASS